jgi:CRISPR-associated endonuclease Csn1
MSKKILGLDLGTNSIGWALINQDFENKKGEILGMGSRIIPMSQDILSEFGKGNSVSQTAERTGFRGIRRIRERHLLRRERLHRVLNILGFLPEHYAAKIDFINRPGKFLSETEPKLAYSNRRFVFENSFNEMISDFQIHQPQLLKNEKGESKLIPHDWTIYYLRKKAITQKIEKQELAWLLLNFNQKRGYYQLRGEMKEENKNKLVEFHSLKVIDVHADEVQKGKTELWYSLKLENGWVYRRQSKIPLFDWKDKIKDFIVTTDLNEDGSVKTDKEGTEKRSFRAPGEDDWTLLKKKTEAEIEKSTETVGTYIYNTLLKNPNQKIKGKLIRTIEREFYKTELLKILNTQKKFHEELQNTELYYACVRELYKYNLNQQEILNKKDFTHLLVEDIIFYQRPLKSQKTNISNCTLESRKYKDSNGNEQNAYLKAAPKSHPLYQEFRIWQWISNLRIYRRSDTLDTTTNFLEDSTAIEELFSFLNSKKEISQEALLKYLLEKKGFKSKNLKTEIVNYRWNYIDDKEKTYPCNETKFLLQHRLSKVQNISGEFLSPTIEEKLWHIVYSVTDNKEFEKALTTFAKKHELDINSFIESFKKVPPFESQYASYSLKALKRLLPLMRIGKYWDWEAIDEKTKTRIHNIIDAEENIEIKESLREKAKNFKLDSIKDYQGLPVWLSNYVVYNRHSEVGSLEKWNSPKDIESYLIEFRQHSLRNPIVEQVITETLRVVKDIWQHYGAGMPEFLNEIHIELGRDMKNTKDERSRITNQVTENENTNLRIKALLAEFQKDSGIINVRPYSPNQQEILKIYEDGVLKSDIEIPEDILKISKTAQPSVSDLQRYKLWLEQKYRSPYTGEIIPLSRLFTTDYEIEHIIPQSRFFDDSLSNKIICESAINQLKGNQLGLEFIKSNSGEIVEIGMGKTVTIFGEEAFRDFVTKQYEKNYSKKSKLLLEDIPDKMIERQLNDTRHLSKFVSEVLSHIVRAETKDEGYNSINLIQGNGKITSILRNDWELDEAWNALILPRFQRMNQLTNSSSFTSYKEKYKKEIPTVPIEFSKGFQKKRIDHRHHALDALVIACATKNHISLLNNQHAKSKERFDLNRKLRHFEKVVYKHPKTGEIIEKEVPKKFIKPWGNFTHDTKESLDKIIVSFKQNLRVINRTKNRYESYKDENGNVKLNKDGEPEKGITLQTKGDSWAIRKSLHQDTIGGLIKIKKQKIVSLANAIEQSEYITDKSLKAYIKTLYKNGFDKKKILAHFKNSNNNWNDKDISKVKIYYWEIDKDGQGINVASRVSLDTSFSLDKIENSIADTAIKKILKNHLTKYADKVDEKGKGIAPETLAFTPEGIEELNKHIIELNDGKFHQPIFKVRTYEPRGNKFNVGEAGNKKDKFAIAAKGTNLFFAIYENSAGKRVYETIPLNEVIEHQKWRATLPKEEQNKMPLVPLKIEYGKFLFILSPNDLVFIPNKEDIQLAQKNSTSKVNSIDISNIYKVVSFTGTQCFFVKQEVATPIVNKVEFSPLNKTEKSIDGIMIKEFCTKLKIDRLGNIKAI